MREIVPALRFRADIDDWRKLRLAFFQHLHRMSDLFLDRSDPLVRLDIRQHFFLGFD
jgi:hypothetical protein